MDITGAELIIRFFETRSHGRRGDDLVSIVPGADALTPIIRAFSDSTLRAGHHDDSQVLIVDLHHGFANIAPVLARAKSQRRAMLCIAIQMRRHLIGTDICRPETTRSMLDSLTQYWFHVGAAMELLQLLPHAQRLVLGDDCGPVLLEIPEDVLTEQIQGAWMPQLTSLRSMPPTLMNAYERCR